MSDLSQYLATHYLVADAKPAKKSKKKKSAAEKAGLVITEDDDSSWSQTRKAEDADDDLAAVAGTSAEFRKAKNSNWKSLSTPTPDSAAADAILASAAAETRAIQDDDDGAPVVEADNIIKMSDGTHAGLQSAAAISAQLKKRQREERDEFERSHKNAKEAETVYRDATGRRIDVSMRRAAARKAAQEAEEKELEAKRALKGEAQLEQARQKKVELEDAAFMSLARHADDEDMNRELKEQQRWNDPMMQFLAPKKSSGKSGSSKNSRPVYQGAAPPNRYGIKPGYRWDGVDRGNGFEAERFKALNKRERHKGLEYSWQMDE